MGIWYSIDRAACTRARMAGWISGFMDLQIYAPSSAPSALDVINSLK